VTVGVIVGVIEGVTVAVCVLVGVMVGVIVGVTDGVGDGALIVKGILAHIPYPDKEDKVCKLLIKKGIDGSGLYVVGALLVESNVP
jgi:hypothetical protein